MPGEDFEMAVQRRLDDELGLAPHALTLALPNFRYRASMGGIEEHELCPVFLCRVSNPPRPNPAEVASIRWQSWSAFVADAAGPDTALSPWSVLQVRELEAGGHVDQFLTASRDARVSE